MAISDMSNARRLSATRNGVILLIVLSALTFFSILVAAFLVFSNESRSTSFALSQSSTRTPDTDAVMEEALMTLIRGTGDKLSPFYGEDLLSDFYGTKDFANVSVFQKPQQISNGFYRVGIELGKPGSNSTRPPHLPQINNAYAGRLITFTKTQSPALNQTFRIAKSINVNALKDYIYIELTTENEADFNKIQIDEAVVNGVPRNATGALVDTVPINGLEVLATKDSGNKVARGLRTRSENKAGITSLLPDQLQPNHMYRQVLKGSLPNRGNSTGWRYREDYVTDFDEDYDAPDFNNWWLAHRRDDDSVIPSFHRPAVLNFLLNQEVSSNDPDNAPPLPVTDPQIRGDLMVSLQRATFRPLPFNPQSFSRSFINQDRTPFTLSTAQNPLGHNQFFTGGNPEFALRTAGNSSNNNYLNQLLMALIGTNGDKWDVDNDLDGKPDSIWVDLGLPLLTTPTGKIIRPLIAPMIEDLGGRLNVNAHDNLAQADDLSIDANFATTGGGNAGRTQFRGSGWGPAEVRIPDFSLQENKDRISKLIKRRYQYGIELGDKSAYPGITVETKYAGRAVRDVGSLLLAPHRWPRHYARGGFGYSNDIYGVKISGIGLNGQLLVDGQRMKADDNPNRYENWNTPYELDPSGKKHGDHLWTFSEMEKSLRSNSYDTDLLNKNNELNDLINGNSRYRHALTTKSVSSDHLTQDFKNSLADLLLDQLRDSLRSSTWNRIIDENPQDPPITNAEVEKLLIEQLPTQLTPQLQTQLNSLLAFIPAEFSLGRKLDLNRPFGNLVDDTSPNTKYGHGVIDEPRESQQGEKAFAHPGDPNNIPNNRSTTPDNAKLPDRFLNASGFYNNGSARQLMARDLYILMMTLSRTKVGSDLIEGFFPPIGGTAFTQEEKQFYKARRLAQWAVNVVDYHDPDSIMTRFVFDDKPFDGWNPPADAKNTVWGVEQPQLIFSESIAFHDVRLRDEERDNGTQERKPPNGNPNEAGEDLDSDQVRIPQGSLFLELYNPMPAIDNVPGKDDPDPYRIDSPDQIHKQGRPYEFYSKIVEPDSNGNLRPQNPAPDALDLGRLAPHPESENKQGAPVWRIAISERHDARVGGQKEDFSPLKRRNIGEAQSLPNSYSFEPANPNELSNGGQTLALDRFVWFYCVDEDPSKRSQAIEEIRTIIDENNISDMKGKEHKVFYPPENKYFNSNIHTEINGTTEERDNANTNYRNQLKPGQFLVMAPRLTTHFGSVAGAGAAVDPEAPPQLKPITIPSRESSQKWQLEFNVDVDVDHPDYQPIEGLYQYTENGLPTEPINDPSRAPLTMVFAAPVPPRPAIPNPPTWQDVFDDDMRGLNVSEPMPDDAGAFYPVPTKRYREDVVDEFLKLDAYINYGTETSNDALDTPQDKQFGLIPFDDNPEPQAQQPILGTVNNYRTAFLQRLADPTLSHDPVTNPYRTVDWISIDLTVFNGEDDAALVSAVQEKYAQRSRQRNGKLRHLNNDATAFEEAPDIKNVLYSYQTDFEATRDVPTAVVGRSYFRLGNGVGSADALHSSFGLLNTMWPGVNPDFNDGFSQPLNNTALGQDQNLPTGAYVQHPWLNRPFASPLELMMVPACSQGRLFEEFSFDTDHSNPLYAGNAGTRKNGLVTRPFRHLLNFFDSGGTPPIPDPDEVAVKEPDPNNPTDRDPNYDTSLEFAQLFDFVHTLPRFRGEIDFLEPSTAFGIDENTNLFKPPFNFIYRNFRQGTINLNTISQSSVWQGLMQNHQTGGVDDKGFNDFLTSRRGYTTTSTPTMVGQGIPINFLPGHLSSDFPTEFAGVFRSSTRSTSVAETTGKIYEKLKNLNRSSANTGLFRDDAIVDSSRRPFFVRSPDSPQHPSTDREKNPYMRYQTLMRMPNLVSDNSQVFLIRMTLGLFEYDPETKSLGREYNADSGNGQRRQATFIIDRSIPVGFQPGNDLNTRNVVIYESYNQ